MIIPKTAYNFKFLDHRPTKSGMSTENGYLYKAMDLYVCFLIVFQSSNLLIHHKVESIKL